MEWDEGELFPQRRATIVQKAAKTEGWIRFLSKGEQGTCGEKQECSWEKKAECFLKLTSSKTK